MENTALGNSKINIDPNHYLYFTVGADSYGLDIGQVREVIEYSQIIHLTKIPMVHESIIGVINLRGEVIPVIDLSMRLYNKKINLTQDTFIIIIEIDEEDEQLIIGALTDAVKGVFRIPDEDITKSPGFGTKIRSDFISSFGKIGSEFIALLNAENLLNINELSELSGIDVDIKKLLSKRSVKEDELTFSSDSKEKAESIDEGEQQNYITISIEDELYGIEMSCVKEIIKTTEMRSVPNTMPFMKGVINLRGKIVPVVDMRERCNLKSKKYDRKTSVLIIALEDFLIGLVVDAAYNVIKISKNNIQYPPHYSAKINADFIRGVSEVNDKLILLLDVNKILSTEEHDYIINKDFEEDAK